MSDIEFKENAVCYADGGQWFLNESGFYNNKPLASEDRPEFESFEYILNRSDFQLNEPRQGDYLPKSELDIGQKYNDAVEVFELFGFNGALGWEEQIAYDPEYFYIDKDTSEFDSQRVFYEDDMKRKLTYNQLMAIGKLKRLMNERKSVEKTNSEIKQAIKNKINSELDKPKRRNKSKQAYSILESLDYEYDQAKQLWYKKTFIAGV